MIELHACRSSGSRFSIAFPPAQRALFLQQITDRPDAFFGMLGRVNTAKSVCSLDTDRDRIFAAVRRLDGGFSALDQGVMSTMLEWLQQQLEEEIAAAVAVGQTDVECRMMNALVIVFACIGEYDRALPLSEECLAKGKRVFGEDHPRTLTSLFCIAGLFESKGEYDRALPLHEECLAKRKRVLGEDHHDTLIQLHDLAILLKNMGKNDRALPLFEQCLAKGRCVLGEDHPDTLIQLSNVAILLKNMGEYDRALPLYEECLEKRKRVLGEDHPDTLTSLKNVALVLKQTAAMTHSSPKM